MEYQVTSPRGASTRISAASPAAARRLGRAALGLKPSDPVKVKRSAGSLNIQVGGMKIDDQLQFLSTYSQLLISRTPVDEAFRRLSGKLKAPMPNEQPSDTMRRSGFHPYACAILSGGEAAGRADEGAAKAAEWLAEREQLVNVTVGPARTQAIMALLFINSLFALPVGVNEMFDRVPLDLLQINHTFVSAWLLKIYGVLFAPFPTLLVLAFMWAVFGMGLWAVWRAPDEIKRRFPMVGPLAGLKAQENLAAWLSIYLPFHVSRLPHADFVEAGVRACQRGPLAQSFRQMQADLRTGEVDSLATAVGMRPEVVPAGMHEALTIMGAMNIEAGEAHIRALLGLTAREMRRLGIKASRQSKFIRNLAMMMTIIGVLMGVYLPLLQSSPI